MGGLCSEGHEFIRLCRSREQAAADHMIDVLVTQHSRWTARRIHRALFGQSLIDFGGDSWTCVSSQAGKAKISNRCRGKKCAMQTCILSKFSRQFTSSREAGGTTEVFLEDEESPVEYVSSDNDSSEEDEEECVEQEPEFSGIGAHGRMWASEHEQRTRRRLAAADSFSQLFSFIAETRETSCCSWTR